MMSQRHQLIYLSNHAPFTLISQHQDHAMIHQSVNTWINKGFPSIFARQDADNLRYVKLGLPLRMAQKVYRVTLLVEQV